jgi:hypothetical protein
MNIEGGEQAMGIPALGMPPPEPRARRYNLLTLANGLSYAAPPDRWAPDPGDWHIAGGPSIGKRAGLPREH